MVVIDIHLQIQIQTSEYSDELTVHICLYFNSDISKNKKR